MTTVPGFSSRDTTHHVKQLPQRDEALMSENHEPGWSNSKADSAARIVTTEVTAEVVAPPAVVTVNEPTQVTPKKATRAPRKSAGK